MTNYNKRLDEVLQNLSWKQHELGTKGLIPLSKHEYEAKQAINTLVLEHIIGEEESDNGYDKIIERMIKDKQRARIK